MTLLKKAGIKIKSFLKIFGPGLITGASDDDPSGIATYSQAGAQFGLSTLWTALITFPLMASIQEMCARIGLATSRGLTGTLKKYYPKWVLYVMILFSFPAIVMNIGADIAGMGAVANLIVPKVNAIYFSVAFTIILLVIIIYFPYHKIAAILKYLAMVLLVYLVVPFLVKTNWGNVLKATFMPHIRLSKDYLNILVAILGTTISPYLFFWQATMEVEELEERQKKQKKIIIASSRMYREMKTDVNTGMLFSNLVMFFIILTTGAILASAGIHKIETVEQAASALRPLAGDGAYYLFAVGVIGTGFLAIPVLSGSLSYIFSETFDWQMGFDKKFHQAPSFYIIIALSLLVGLLMNYLGINPIQELIYSAILYGVTAPVIIAVILHICNNKTVMGEHINKTRSNILGTLTFLLMAVAAIFLLYYQFTT
ncbi:MAG TPA: Nramp family divalent metal transporter [Flavipsychrobacter sp.]|nr:Nramp family divalent metal transporter [Flavipsychrobacter sp.]